MVQITNPFSNAALVLVGHGSTLNPDSSSPTWEHAARIEAMGLFAEVACCFWKEEPNMREVHEVVESPEVYIVPNFISEGYFCQQVLPRELGLDGPWTLREGKRIGYCDPVGIHPSMARLLLQRADEVAAGIDRSQIGLIIVGHGTSLNDNSTKAIKDQVALIRDGGHGFAEVVDAYMEEAPLVSDWDKLTSAPHVVVVPFFIADGLHSFQDIPVLLGMNEEPGMALSQMEVFRQNPITLRGRQLHYSQAIGTEPLLAEVVVEQVRSFLAKHGGQRPEISQPATAQATEPTRTNLAALTRWVHSGRSVIGQVRIRQQDSHWIFNHIDDGEPKLPCQCSSLDQARQWARWDAAGEFRPLKTAPNLKPGVCLRFDDDASALKALDILYPAALAVARRHEQGDLEATPLRHLLARQTGMYRFVNSLSDEACGEVVARSCAQTKCLRRILYGLDKDKPLPPVAEAKTGMQAGQCVAADQAIPLLCIESCSHILSAARVRAKRDFDAKASAQNGGAST